ncbi:MAG: hypothetical protein J5787_04085 [Alphaproteobacteria bacterium]|nr:hypothetical protein [Alphaproteobacteria bacterium]
MRKIIIIFILAFFPLNTFAAEVNDAEDMGRLAGVVLACNAHKTLYQFEEIISRYFSNTSPNEDVEKALIRDYAQAKANSFSIYRYRKNDCAQTIREFSQMPIFKSELYSDGSLRLPDGKFLYPRGQRKLAKGAERIYPSNR